MSEQDQKMLDFYSRFAAPGALFFDVGANVGNRTKIFLELGMSVVSVEPQSRCARFLASQFGWNRNLTIVQKALGSSSGEAEIMIGSADTLSSLSAEWIEAVRSSGRFSGYSWERKAIVPMTTLDQLISQHGVPSFVKIDVEGYEHEVIAGLSSPIGEISLEFTPEFLGSAFKCIDHLESLSEVSFNYSIGESMELELEEYVSSSEIKEILKRYRDDSVLFGDLYCQAIG